GGLAGSTLFQMVRRLNLPRVRQNSCVPARSAARTRLLPSKDAPPRRPSEHDRGARHHVFHGTRAAVAALRIVVGAVEGAGGVLAAAFAAGVLTASLPSGLVAARFGPQRAALVGVAVTAVASFVFAFAGDAWALGAARLLQGVGSALSWAGALAWLVAPGPAPRA